MTANSYVLIRHVCGEQYEIAKTGTNGSPNIIYKAFFRYKEQTYRLYPLSVRYVGNGDIVSPHTIPAARVLPY